MNVWFTEPTPAVSPFNMPCADVLVGLKAIRPATAPIDKLVNNLLDICPILPIERLLAVISSYSAFIATNIL